MSSFIKLDNYKQLIIRKFFYLPKFQTGCHMWSKVCYPSAGATEIILPIFSCARVAESLAFMLRNTTLFSFYILPRLFFDL